jgi:hypothetical protein
LETHSKGQLHGVTAPSDAPRAPQLAIVVDGTVVFRGQVGAVPREGDRLVHNGEVAQVQSGTWTFGADQSSVSVEVAVSGLEYTV